MASARAWRWPIGLVARWLTSKGDTQLNSQQHHDRIAHAFEAACDRWRGCNWHSPIGPAGIDVQELTSRQASLLAEATCGEESQRWEAASKWLAQVEQDALAAEKFAAAATEQVQRNEYTAALDNINRAVALEAQYRPPQVWCALQHLIAELALKSSLY